MNATHAETRVLRY